MLSGADLARMERCEADGTVTGVAAWSLAPVRLAVGTRFPLDGSSIARDVRRTGVQSGWRVLRGRLVRLRRKRMLLVSARPSGAPSSWPANCGG